jgi:hypothetical protein
MYTWARKRSRVDSGQQTPLNGSTAVMSLLRVDTSYSYDALSSSTTRGRALYPETVNAQPALANIVKRSSLFARPSLCCFTLLTRPVSNVDVPEHPDWSTLCNEARVGEEGKGCCRELALGGNGSATSAGREKGWIREARRCSACLDSEPYRFSKSNEYTLIALSTQEYS